MAFFKQIAATFNALLPNFQETSLTEQQYDPYKKQISTIQNILHVSKREDESKKLFYQLLYFVRDVDFEFTNETQAKKLAHENNAHAQDLHYYLLKELAKRLEQKLAKTPTKEQTTVLLNKKKVRTATAISRYATTTM